MRMQVKHSAALVAATLATSGLLVAQQSEYEVSNQQGVAAEKQLNAALEYWQVWSTEDSEFYKLFRELWIYSAGEDELVQVEMRRALRDPAQQRYIQRLIDASEIDHCDFQVRPEEGPDRLVSHVYQMTHSVRLLCMDAKRLIQFGSSMEDYEHAAERVAAAYRMIMHLMNNEGSDMITVIGSVSVVNDILDKCLAQARSGYSVKLFDEVVSDTIEAINQNLKRPSDSSVQVIIQTIKALVEDHQSPGVLFAEKMKESLTQSQAQRLSEMNAEDFRNDLEKIRSYYADLSEAMVARDEIRAKKVHDELINGRYGLMARFVVVDPVKYYEHVVPSISELESLHERIEMDMVRMRER